MKLLLLWMLALFFFFDSLVRALRTTLNLGSALMYLLTIWLWCYALFYPQIDALCMHGIGRILKIIFLCGCVLMLSVAAFLSATGYHVKADGNEPVVVVLGAGLRGTRVSGLLARRLDAAYHFYVQHPATLLVVTGGQGPGEAVPEACAMRDYLVEKGIPQAQILVENQSTSTEENFLFARRLLEAHGISSAAPIAFSTNRFHCYRAGKYAKNVGFSDARALPASTGFTSVMPCYMREVVAVLYFWICK